MHTPVSGWARISGPGARYSAAVTFEEKSEKEPEASALGRYLKARFSGTRDYIKAANETQLASGVNWLLRFRCSAVWTVVRAKRSSS